MALFFRLNIVDGSKNVQTRARALLQAKPYCPKLCAVTLTPKLINLQKYHEFKEFRKVQMS